jgi:hypothetical protein
MPALCGFRWERRYRMSMKHALTTAIWLLCFYAPVVAQDERPLKVRIIDSVREREPEWMFSREEGAHSEERKGEALLVVWAKGRARLLAVVYEHKSKEDAEANYKYYRGLFRSFDAKETDDSYLVEIHASVSMDGPGRWYAGSESKLHAHLLRRGQIVIWVVGDTPELVKRFSALIATQCPAT